MLKSIKVSNFYSIGEEQEISLEITPKDIMDDSAKQTEKNLALNLVSCVIGHNASGKTTLLKAITFLCWFIQHSYSGTKDEQDIPVKAHKLKKDDPTTIEVEFLNHGTLYKYRIKFNRKEVMEEVLWKKNVRMTRVFKLIRNEGKTEVETKIKINETDMDRFKKRSNVALLSCLIDTGYLSDIYFFKRFESNVTERGLINRNYVSSFLSTSKLLYENEMERNQILEFSKNIDLGIYDFRFLEITLQNSEGDEKKQVLQCVHKSEKVDFSLGLFEESNGTQQSFSILSEVLPILKTGGLIVLDEIESGLHPLVAKKIISLFESKEENLHNAQLIFSTHQHLLLNDRTKTQIFLAEKDGQTFETEIYRLDDVEGVRNDENYFHKYIAGAYGGTPRIDWF